jgi:hypothetical protein
MLYPEDIKRIKDRADYQSPLGLRYRILWYYADIKLEVLTLDRNSVIWRFVTSFPQPNEGIEGVIDFIKERENKFINGERTKEHERMLSYYKMKGTIRIAGHKSYSDIVE